MNKVENCTWRNSVGGWLFVLFALAILFLPSSAYASKSISISSNEVSVTVDKTIEVPVTIDTDGEKVNAVGFSIEFSTEILEGLTPDQGGSVLPMCAVLSATRYDCGITGQNGFSGKGLVTTLKFKGRKVGNTTIKLNNIEARYGPQGAIVPGIASQSNAITLAAIEAGTQQPSNTDTSTSETKEKTSPIIPTQIETPTSALPTLNPPNVTPEDETPPNPSEPGQTTGSEPQVKGPTGAAPEEPIKPAPEQLSEEVRGSFTNPATLSFIPTVLLLMLVAFLGTKLYFTERRRHLELEHLFENHIGTIATLESKLELFDQKGEGQKEKIVQEFEIAKEQLSQEAENTLEDKPKTEKSK